MKKKIISTISILAAVILIAGNLTACGKSENTNTANEAVTETDSETVSESQTQSTEKTSIKSTEKSEESKSTAVNSDEWKKAYKKILTAPHGEYEFIPQSFALIKLDGDDIPELILSGGGSHMDTVRVYTFYNGKTVYCGEFGSFGAIGYSGNKIVGVFTSGAGAEIQEITVNEVNEGKHKVVWYGKQFCEMEAENEFYSGEKKVSLEEFQKRYNEFVPDSISFVGYGIGPAVDTFSEAFGCKTVKMTDKSEELYSLTDGDDIISQVLGD